jgi:hypothetical protein
MEPQRKLMDGWNWKVIRIARKGGGVGGQRRRQGKENGKEIQRWNAVMRFRIKALWGIRIQIQIQTLLLDDKNCKKLQKNVSSSSKTWIFCCFLFCILLALQNIKFFSYFCGSFCPPGSRSAFPMRIRIQPTKTNAGILVKRVGARAEGKKRTQEKIKGEREKGSEKRCIE